MADRGSRRRDRDLAEVRERIEQLIERRGLGTLSAEEQAEYLALLEEESELLRDGEREPVIDLRAQESSAENGAVG